MSENLNNNIVDNNTFTYLEQPSSHSYYENGLYYYLVLEKNIYADATVYCGKKFPKGTLAEIDTLEKLTAVYNIYQKISFKGEFTIYMFF